LDIEYSKTRVVEREVAQLLGSLESIVQTSPVTSTGPVQGAVKELNDRLKLGDRFLSVPSVFSVAHFLATEPTEI